MKNTALPLSQIAIIVLLRFCETASISVVFPFLNELLTSVTGGDEKKVGYYAGLMDAIRQLTSLVTVMFWSRMSDHVGRKPILLLGMLALVISNLSFGLSRTFWALVVSRCIFTAFNSNYWRHKERCWRDYRSNQYGGCICSASPFLGNWQFIWSALTGGSLARPHDHFPKMFSSCIWINYPYFLPYVVLAVITVIVLAVAAA